MICQVIVSESRASGVRCPGSWPRTSSPARLYREASFEDMVIFVDPLWGHRVALVAMAEHERDVLIHWDPDRCIDGDQVLTRVVPYWLVEGHIVDPDTLSEPPPSGEAPTPACAVP